MIKVGDIVKDNAGIVAVVMDRESDSVLSVFTENGLAETWTGVSCEKTGDHIDQVGIILKTLQELSRKAGSKGDEIKEMTVEEILAMPQILCDVCYRRFKEVIEGTIDELVLCDECNTKYRVVFK